jgi:hypothetical protein
MIRPEIVCLKHCKVGVYDLMGDAVDFMRKAIGIVQQHYPERSHAVRNSCIGYVYYRCRHEN